MNTIKSKWSNRQSIAALKQQIEQGEEMLRLNSRGLSYDQLENWKNATEHYLCKAFGENSPQSTVLTQKFAFALSDRTDAEILRDNANKMRRHLGKVSSAVEILETEDALVTTGNIDQANRIPFGGKVFLVHGRDEGAKQEVARFLEKIKLDVVILSELPDQGRTIIEKFEQTTKGVGFAVILLTADDIGGLKSASYEDLQARARQNVILELGHFIGKLGRSRVCALFQDGVEIPSDYSGVLYIPIDQSGGWKLCLARELKAANFVVDLNDCV